MCARAEVALVGGGNSAGQAAVYLSQHAAKVSVLVRGPSLAASMSSYLIERIAATGNIELCPHSELTQLHGEPGQPLEAVSWRSGKDGRAVQHAVRNVFLFVGADPETTWLAGCGVQLDAHGFVATGAAAIQPGQARPPGALESSVPGVFAVGDVRSGSIKRVGAAIGEGAAAVAAIHQHLAALQR